MVRMLSVTALLSSLALPLCAQGTDTASHRHQHDDADQAVEGGGSVPAGWTIRADAKGNPKNVKVVTMGKGLHLTLGPAIILYRAEDDGAGPFHTLATFTQTKQTDHAEGYGLFFGGQDLTGAGQKYTYFLVRQDGSYLVKTRDGDKTTEITKGWVKHASVHQPDAKGVSTNLLEVDAKRDPAKVSFKVNGETVQTVDASSLNLKGIVGLRANHHLDLHVEGFAVHR
ncbi:MAG TPA: hypothetical protein VH763_06615 [Gemmatimonadales bacterium]|jgi:hypothetical protein